MGKNFKMWKMKKIDFLRQLLQNWSEIDFVKSTYWEITFFTTIAFFMFFSFHWFWRKIDFCVFAQNCHKKSVKKNHFQHQNWGPKHNFCCLTLFLNVNSYQKISEFISQTIFTELWMWFFVVWKNCRQLWTKPASVTDK